MSNTIDQGGSHLGLARIAVEEGDLDSADGWLQKVPPGEEGRQSAEYQKLWFSTRATKMEGVDTLREGVDADDADLGARWELALSAQGELEEALEYLLEIVRRDRQFRDDIGRKTMLRIFPLLDADSRRQWQRRLGQAMY